MFRLVWVLALLLLTGCLPSALPFATEMVSLPPRVEPAPSPVAILPPLSEPDPVDPQLTAQVLSAVATPLPSPVESYLALTAPLPYAGDFPLAEHPRIDRLVKFYTGNGRRTFSRWLERAARHIPRIQLVFASEGLPLDLAYLAMIESGFNERAYSWAHAAGPWQFIESTGRIYGLENDWWRDERRDIDKSTRAAARFLKDLNRRFKGNWHLAVAAYNAGGGKVNKAVRTSGSRDFWRLTEGKVLREETKNYLPKLLATLKIVREPERYGFTGLNFQQPQLFETVRVATSTDLEVVASLAGTSYRQIKSLNPELKRWCTPPGVSDYRLRVPYGSAELFIAQYAALPAAERALYHRHQIASGDTLRKLARQYRIQVDDIMSLNGIRDPRTLQIGDNLILPLREGFTQLPVDELADDYIRSRRRTYKVRQGDSLWKIAQRFGVTEKQLRVWNRLGWSNLLRPGQVLAVSKKGQRTAGRASRVSRKLVYQVRPGDTLWGIGRRYDVATDQIRSWNDLGQSHVLRPGQKLTLLVSSSRRS